MNKKKIGIVGCGAIGEGVAFFIDKELAGQAVLFGIHDKNSKKAEDLRGRLVSRPGLYTIEALVKKADLVIEAASIDAAQGLIPLAFCYQKDVVILSVGALIGADYFQAALKHKVNIYVPSGAIGGADVLGALSLGRIKRILLVTSKPPKGVKGAAGLRGKGVKILGLKKPAVIFKGNVKEAVASFPQNINVAATLLLASRYPDVEVRIRVDPGLKRNSHSILVEAEQARAVIKIENVPSSLNPKTSNLAILSTQALLFKMFSPLKIGS